MNRFFALFAAVCGLFLVTAIITTPTPADGIDTETASPAGDSEYLADRQANSASRSAPRTVVRWSAREVHKQDALESAVRYVRTVAETNREAKQQARQEAREAAREERQQERQEAAQQQQTTTTTQTQTTTSSSGSGNLPALLLTIRANESGGNYQAYNPTGCEGYGCGGAFQMHVRYAAGWAAEAGYPGMSSNAATWPPEIQDAVALYKFYATNPDGLLWCQWATYC